MPRPLTILAAATVLAAALVACSSDDAATDAASATTSTAAAPSTAEAADPTPTAPPTAPYTAPEGNEVADHVIATYVPEGYEVTDVGASDRLLFSNVSPEELQESNAGSGYAINLLEQGVTLDDVVAEHAAMLAADPSEFTRGEEVSVDGETAQTFTVSITAADGSGYLTEQGAIVTHNDQTFAIIGLAVDTVSQPELTEQEFRAFLDGLVWAD